MNDDLSTPAAVAVIHETMREGNRLANVPDPEGATRVAGRVRAMLAVLGLDPGDPHWATGESSSDLREVVDVLVQGLLDRRTEARAAKDFAAADAIRDQIKAAGIEIEDTPDGPKWSVQGAR